jgi:hypothetical protein
MKTTTLIPVYGRLKGKTIIKTYATIDSEDFEKVSKFRWFLRLGYCITTSNRKTISMHKLIINIPKGMFSDHINRIRTDNRKENLRVVTQSQNAKNYSKPKVNHNGDEPTSKYKGISYDSSTEKWICCIACNGKNITVGRYKNEKEAARAYNLASRLLHGTFGLRNKI